MREAAYNLEAYIFIPVLKCVLEQKENRVRESRRACMRGGCNFKQGGQGRLSQERPYSAKL